MASKLSFIILFILSFLRQIEFCLQATWKEFVRPARVGDSDTFWKMAGTDTTVLLWDSSIRKICGKYELFIGRFLSDARLLIHKICLCMQKLYPWCWGNWKFRMKWWMRPGFTVDRFRMEEYKRPNNHPLSGDRMRYKTLCGLRQSLFLNRACRHQEDNRERSLLKFGSVACVRVWKGGESN